MHKGAIHPTISFHASGSPIYIVDLIIKINEMSKQNLNWSFQPCILQVAQFMSSDHTPLFKSRDIFPPLRHLRPSNPWPLEKWIAPPPAGCFKCRFFSTRASVIVSWICFVRILEDQNKTNVPSVAARNVFSTFHVCTFPLIVATMKKPSIILL